MIEMIQVPLCWCNNSTPPPPPHTHRRCRCVPNLSRLLGAPIEWRIISEMDLFAIMRIAFCYKKSHGECKECCSVDFMDFMAENSRVFSNDRLISSFDRSNIIYLSFLQKMSRKTLYKHAVHSSFIK